MKVLLMIKVLLFPFFIAMGPQILQGHWVCKSEKGVTDTIDIDGEVYDVEWLSKDNFESGDWKDYWVLETTDGKVEVKNGKLFITDKGIGSTLWHKGEFPKHIIVRYTARSEVGMSDNKLNFNHISHARENDGTDLVIGREAKRTGAYSQYHQFKNYIATLTYKHSRLRKDPGFTLLSDSKECAVENKDLDVVYVVNEGRIRYYLNNVKIHDVQDSQSLVGGKFGLRTWATHASWDNIEIGLIKGRKASTKLN